MGFNGDRLFSERSLFIMVIDDLIKFAKTYHAGFASVGDSFLRRMFETYRDTTLIYRPKGELKGFAIYQEWPDRLVFITIVGSGTLEENLKAMIRGRSHLPKKPICWFDENKKELRTWRL